MMKTQNPTCMTIIVIIKITMCVGGEGGQSDPLPSTFDTIHSIDLIFGTYNALSLYFQLIETKWCLIGFHGNHSHIKTLP